MNCFAAVADPTRRRIVELLAAQPLSSGEIAARFDITASAISQHLKVLRNAKLVRATVAAQHRIYELDAGGVEEMDAWIQQIRRFWSVRLDALELALKREDGHE